jgi:hypothetical protein
MAEITMEERIKHLENDNEELKKKVQLLEATREIANLMGRYLYLHEVRRESEFIDELYALETPGVSAEVAHYGVFEGKEGIMRMFTHPRPRGAETGVMFENLLTTPVIEVAKDGKTAKGVWISPGLEAIPDPETGNLRGFWCWTKYGCDFVKEDGKWKIWHYHVYRLFRTPYDMDWVEEYEHKLEAKGLQLEQKLKPDKPTSYDHPYSKTTEREYVPAPPEPYETFDDTFSYGP